MLACSKTASKLSSAQAMITETDWFVNWYFSELLELLNKAHCGESPVLIREWRGDLPEATRRNWNRLRKSASECQNDFFYVNWNSRERQRTGVSNLKSGYKQSAWFFLYWNQPCANHSQLPAKLSASAKLEKCRALSTAELKNAVIESKCSVPVWKKHMATREIIPVMKELFRCALMQPGFGCVNSLRRLRLAELECFFD